MKFLWRFDGRFGKFRVEKNVTEASDRRRVRDA
jgi:hypothetical protein